MKYLKSYRLFESIKKSNKQEFDKVLTEISDICLEFNDLEIEYHIHTHSKYYPDIQSDWSFFDESDYKLGCDCIMISLKDIQRRYFAIKDIEEVLLRIKDYLDGTNWHIDCGFPQDDTYLTLKDFFDEFSGEELYDLTIYIYYHTWDGQSLQNIAQNFLDEKSSEYDLRLGKPFDKEKANCSWFTKEFFYWAKSKSLPVEIVYFDSDVEAHIAPLLYGKVIDFAVKQFTKNPNDHYQILNIEDYKKWGYNKHEIIDNIPNWITVRDAKILEKYKLLDYLELGEVENKLNVIEKTFNEIPREGILECVLELCDFGVNFYDGMLNSCLWKGEELVQSKDFGTSKELFTNFKTKNFWTGESIFGNRTIKVLMVEQVESLFQVKTQQEIEQIINNDVVFRTFKQSIVEEANNFSSLIQEGWMPCLALVKQKVLTFKPFPKPEIIDALKEVREKVYNLYGYEMILFPSVEEPSILFVDKKYIQQI